MDIDIPTNTARKIRGEAFEWATDYKPWDKTLHYRRYAEHGYEQGQRALLKKLLEKGIINEEQIKEYGTIN